MKTTIIILGIVIVILFGALIAKNQNLGAVAMNNYDTTSSGFTQATTTINTTSTQIFASIPRLSYITNNTTSTITCSLDASNTTAASSSVTAGRGVLIGSNAGTLIPSVVSFGECRSNVNCYPHRGAVNCLANTAAVITTSAQ